MLDREFLLGFKMSTEALFLVVGLAGASTIGTQISAASAALAAASKTDPNYATLQAKVATLNGQRDTLFKGETLRSMLLNAYGWWTIGLYTTFAGFGLMLVALAALAALVFELFIAGEEIALMRQSAAARNDRFIPIAYLARGSQLSM